MRLTKIGHACVRLEKDDRTLVIDPGVFSDDGALDGADAVLITHEHVDHLNEGLLRAAADANPALRVWANRAVAGKLDFLGHRVTTVGHGDAFDAAGFQVEAHGEWHAVIHPDIPRITNVGFLVDDEVFHPGDAFTVPEDRAVATLLVPAAAPWSKLAEVVDYLREVRPTQAFPIHDAILAAPGLGLVDNLLGPNGPGTNTRYARHDLGKPVDLPD